MKTSLLLLILVSSCLTPIISFSQEKPKLEYGIGFGSSLDAMNHLYGLNFSNELNVRLGKRTSFNMGLLFYQSLGSTGDKSLPNFSNRNNSEQSSGIFITPTLQYDLIQSPSGFNLAFSAGPSLQLGGETYLRSISYGTDIPDYTYFVNKYQRIGLMLELEAEWNSKNPNRRNAVSISAFGADNAIPWYLNATYKLKFNVGKK